MAAARVHLLIHRQDNGNRREVAKADSRNQIVGTLPAATRGQSDRRLPGRGITGSAHLPSSIADPSPLPLCRIEQTIGRPDSQTPACRLGGVMKAFGSFRRGSAHIRATVTQAAHQFHGVL